MTDQPNEPQFNPDTGTWTDEDDQPDAPPADVPDLIQRLQDSVDRARESHPHLATSQTARGVAAGVLGITDQTEQMRANAEADQQAYDYAARTISPEFAAALAPNHDSVMNTVAQIEDHADTDGHVHHVEGEDPQTAALREAVNTNRQLLGIDKPGSPRRVAQVAADAAVQEMTDRVTAAQADPGPSLDPPGGAVAAYRKAYLAKAREIGAGYPFGMYSPTAGQLDECIAAGLAAANAVAHPVAVFDHHDRTEPTGAAMVYDRDARLEVKWLDRASHVTCTPEVIEGFVDQINQLRAQSTGQGEHLRQLEQWVARIVDALPASYEDSNTRPLAWLDQWIRDLEAVAGPFLTELRELVPAHALFGAKGLFKDLVVPLPDDPTDLGHLFDAAARLGGE